MPLKIDLTGQRFVKLIVVKQDGDDGHGHICWLCKCDCGRKKTISSNSLRRGVVKSCGCFSISTLTKRNTKHGQATRNNRSRLYKIWTGMIKRCNNPNATDYLWYGNRNITVCDR